MDKQNGRKIKMITWPDNDGESGQQIKAEGDLELALEYRFCGDHDESWVVQSYNNKEVARYNAKYLESIIWAD
jgi:hypothetical protein